MNFRQRLSARSQVGVSVRVTSKQHRKGDEMSGKQPARLIKDLQWVLSIGAIPVLACESEDNEPDVFTISVPFHNDLHGEGQR